MGSRNKYTTDEERLDARRLSKLKYDQSPQSVAKLISKKHISRLVLPDLLEDWACADLRQDYGIFSEALQANFDETECVHWLNAPPFNAEAIALAEDRTDYDDYSNYYVSCLVDGCLLRREQRREEAFKQELTHVGKKKMVNSCRVELQGLLAGDWADIQAKKMVPAWEYCLRMLPSTHHQSDLTLASIGPGANVRHGILHRSGSGRHYSKPSCFAWAISSVSRDPSSLTTSMWSANWRVHRVSSMIAINLLQHYIIKGDSVTHIHRPTAYKFEEDPEIARFLSTGLLPGAVPKEDEI
ncbi:hypothetical protein C8F01DRAFT_1092977 [Mycena amicta]|nr:hypothetical protein C8F01DRAFT_1092977 [Mycena amicta]